MTLLPMDDPQATMFDGPNSQFLRNLPKAPPNRSTNPFAKENRRDTLLAIGAGMMRGGNLGESMANAADAILSSRKDLRSRTVKQTELGGPDDAFEIVTDPETGERSYRQVPGFQEYLAAQAQAKNQPKPDDIVKQRGAVMGSILAAPKEQRQALYTRLIADPQFVSLGLPEAWDEGLAAAYRDQAVSPADQQKIAILRGRADVDRIENERDYEINLRRVGQTDKRLSAPPSTRRAKISSGNADLSYLLGN